MHIPTLRPPAALLPAASAWRLAAELALTALVACFGSWWFPRARVLATGLATVAGAIFLVGIAVPPAHPAEEVPALLLGASACAGLMAAPRLARFRWGILGFFAVLAGWWLAGAPDRLPALAHALPRLLITAGWLFGLAWLLTAAEGWAIAAASFALFAALYAVGAASPWPLLAAGPAAACAVAPRGRKIQLETQAAPTPRRRRTRQRPRPRPSSGKRAVATPKPATPPGAPTPLLPAALAVAVVAAAAAAAGRGLTGPADAAALAPVAAIWLLARLRRRLRWAAPVGDPVAVALTVALVAVLAFSAAALTGLR